MNLIKLLILPILLFFFLTSKGQDNEYNKGYYIDTSGVKIEGYIKLERELWFKTQPNSEVNTISFKEINQIKKGEYKYLVIRKIKIKPELGIASTTYKNLVVSETLTGKINLYKTILNVNIGQLNDGIGLNYDEDFYLVQKGSNEEIIQIKTANKKFRKQIVNLIQDNPEYMKEIKINKITYYDLKNIIEKYNLQYIH